MKAVIMAGGKGTRLQPLTRNIPKPMLQLLDRPAMEYIVEQLKHHGFNDVTMTVCYLAETIRGHFGSGSRFGITIRYQEEPIPLGTAGGLKPLEQHLNETFIVMSGDGLTDFDLSDALRQHRQSGCIATLLLTKVQCPLGYGLVDIDAARIQRFIEKPTTWVDGQTYLINTGIYILEPEVFRFIPSGQPYDFGRELFPSLIENGVPLHGHIADGYWSDVGTLVQYYQTQLDMIHGKVKVTLPVEVQPLTPVGVMTHNSLQPVLMV